MFRVHHRDLSKTPRQSTGTGGRTMISGFAGPAQLLTRVVFLLGNRSTIIAQASVMPGSSFFSTLQTILPNRSTSMTRLPLPHPISLPLLRQLLR